jgi:hypothetical protein
MTLPDDFFSSDELYGEHLEDVNDNLTRIKQGIYYDALLQHTIDNTSSTCGLIIAGGKNFNSYWHTDGRIASFDDEAEYPKIYKRLSAAKKKLAELSVSCPTAKYELFIWTADDTPDVGNKYSQMKNQFPGSPRH